jgi:hypothetical protein
MKLRGISGACAVSGNRRKFASLLSDTCDKKAARFIAATAFCVTPPDRVERPP